MAASKWQEDDEPGALLFPQKKASPAPPAALPLATVKGQRQGKAAPNLKETVQEIRTQAQAIVSTCDGFLAVPDQRKEPPQALVTGLAGPVLALEQLAVDAAHAIHVPDWELWGQLPAEPLTVSKRSLVSVQAAQDRVSIRMPLLPPRDVPGLDDLDAATTMLATALMGCSLPKWDTWQASFCHVYPSNASSPPKDVDNFSYKRTLDLLALMMGQSDSAEVCTVVLSCRIDDSVPPGTYIEITEKSSDFPLSHFAGSEAL